MLVSYGLSFGTSYRFLIPLAFWVKFVAWYLISFIIARINWFILHEHVRSLIVGNCAKEYLVPDSVILLSTVLDD